MHLSRSNNTLRYTNFCNFRNPTPGADSSLELPIWPQLKSDKLVYLEVDRNVTVKANPKHYIYFKSIFAQYMQPPFYVY